MTMPVPAPRELKPAVKTAKQVLTDLGFTVSEKTLCFGFEPDGVETDESLHFWLNSSKDVPPRADMIIGIKSHLERLVGKDIEAQKAFLTKEQEGLHGDTVKSLMTSGRYEMLQEALSFMTDIDS